MNPIRRGILLLICAICMSASAAFADVQTQDEKDEAYAYSLGIHAYTFGFPWVYLTQLRYLWTQVDTGNPMVPYAPVNTFFLTDRLANADYRHGGSPNNDTLYAITWLDLSDEPIILSHPTISNRYFTFEMASMDSDNFAYVGLRETGPEAGDFAIVGPDWQGTLPKGVREISRSRTNTVLILGRILVDGPDDVENALAVSKQFRLTPLSQWGSGEEPQVEPRTVQIPVDRASDPLADWKIMNAAMTENPPEARHQDLLDQFATIHVGPGQDVEQASEAMKRGLARASRDGLAMFRRVIRNGTGQSVNGWTYPPASMGRAGLANQFLIRAALQCLSGIIANEPQEAVYLNTFKDASDEVLNGDQRYEIRFGKEDIPPIDELGFWSMTMYGLDYNFVGNEIDRYSIGNRTDGLVFGDDGSLTLYLQSNRPDGDKAANWLPSPAGQDFYVVLRTYLPKAPIVEQTWAPPEVRSTE